MTKTEWSKRLLSTSSYQPINRISNCMFYNSTSILLMWELHVKIDNQAFMFIHVVEQVQLFKWVQHVISASPSDSEIVRGDQVVPVRSTVLTQLINSKVLWIKKNGRHPRLEVMEKSGVLCAAMCDWPTCAISVCCQFLVHAHAKFWLRLHAAEQRKSTQRNMKLCRHAHISAHVNSTVICSLILMFIIRAGVGEKV